MFLDTADAVFSHTVTVPVRQVLAWDCMTNMEHERRWMGMKSVSREDVLGGRMQPGILFHGAYEMADFRYRVLDWRPPEYYSTFEWDPFSELKNYGIGSIWSTPRSSMYSRSSRLISTNTRLAGKRYSIDAGAIGSSTPVPDLYQSWSV